MALIGCGGATNFPDSVASSSAAGPPLQGNVYGGHAPIQGAHVYLLQPGTTGYGSAATSILGTGTTTTPGGFTLVSNTSDPNVPAGAMYEVSDSGGNYNFTGAYACTVGQPVYIYAFGGNIGATTSTGTTTFTISQIVVTNAGGGTATYTFTINSTQALTVGQSVTIAGLNGFSIFGGDDFAILNKAQTVIANPAPTTTTFSFTATDTFGFGSTIANGTYVPNGNPNNPIGNGTATAAVTTTTPPAQNSSVVQLATLGNCPASGATNFGSGSSDPISFIYMNEVSTVATAYTFQPFTLATHNDAWHIGSSGTTQALLGIANAASTAAQLYNIQGTGPSSTTPDGEGHIANATTPNGNGTVPQAKIDSLANILAACVDSTTASSQCTAIFNVATDNGETNGTKPVDTGTAAINIARFPDGNGVANTDANYTSDLNSIPTGTVPFTPNLGNTAPNDWTLSISYTGGGLGTTDAEDPHDVAVDASGNIYTTNFTGAKLAIFSPLGVPASSTGFGTNLNEPGSVAIDSTSSFVWLVNYGTDQNVSRFTTAGGGETEFPTGQAELQDAEIDGSGNVWVTSDNGNALIKLNSAGALQKTITANIATPYGIAIQPGAAGSVWVANEAADDASAVTNAGTALTGSPFAGNTGRRGRDTDVEAPIGTAIDSTGNVWLANHNGTVSALTSAGGDFTGSPFTTGSTNYNDSLAIDGSNNIWVTNTLSDTVFVLNDAGATITPNAGYVTSPATEPDGIAIDPSGNVWYDSANAAVLYEVIGAASPTVTPLSAAVANSKLGTKP